MSNSFRKRYPDFADIEQHIRRAHAERQVAIATAFADGIVAAVRTIGRLFSDKSVARTAAGRVPIKATVRSAARV
jgi:hypothetical protein